MSITLNGTTGITSSGDITLNNGNADGAQVTLTSSGYSNWNIDNYSGRFRAYYNATEYFTIDTSGNVGIGTTSPATKLQVVGASGSLNARINAGNTGLDITSNDATGVTDVATSPLGAGGKVMTFTTYNGSSSAERMRIDSSGNVLVGTTSNTPSGGTAKQYNLATGTTVGLGVSVNNTGYSLINFFYNNSTLVGTISTNGTGVTYGTSSDYRLKENIVPMTGALDKVAQLKPVTYKWKIDGSDGQGFIAHELAEVVPDCVVGEKDAVDEEGNPKYQGVDTSYLVATLTAAIQEQQTIINDLKARVTALETSNV